MIFRNTIFLFIATYFFALEQLSVAADAHAEGITFIRKDLEHLETQLESLKLKNDKNQPGVQTKKVENLLQHADQAFADKEFLATIRILNEALNLSPQQEIKTYLKSQYLLGRSYEELSLYNRAIRAYLRYVSSFTTQTTDTDNQLIEVIRRTLLIHEKSSSPSVDQLPRILANLMSIPMSKKTHQQISLLSGIAAYHAKQYDLAKSWLLSISQGESPLKIKAEATFYAGLNYLALGKDKDAETKFLEILTLDDAHLSIIKSMATLNLARLFAAKKMPQHAWDWYQRVEGPGTALRLATYESIVLLMQSQEYSKSLQLAQTYLKNYPKTKEAYRIQEWISFLELQSGRLDSAEGKLQNRDLKLQELQTDLFEKYSGKNSIDLQDISDIKSKTEYMALQSNIIENGQNLFQKINHIDSLLIEIKQQTQSLIYTLAHTIDPHLRPEIHASNKQYRNYMKSLFAIGEKLLTEEQKVYDKKLSLAEKNSLFRSTSRLQKIYAIDNNIQRHPWESWAKALSMQLQISKTSEKLEKNRLYLQSVVLRGSTNSSTALEKDQTKQAEDLTRQILVVQNSSSEILQNLSAIILDHTKSPTEFRTTKKILLLASQEFIDSSSILQNYRDDSVHPLDKHEQQEYAKAWNQWQAIASKILYAIKEDEKKQSNWLAEKVEEIKLIKKKENDLIILNSNIRKELAVTAARAFPSVLDHFQFNIRQQQSRANKWLADLQWQKYLIQTEEKMRLKSENEKNQNELQESLKDLEIERAMHD